jgi:hypothetical protein
MVLFMDANEAVEGHDGREGERLGERELEEEKARQMRKCEAMEWGSSQVIV